MRKGSHHTKEVREQISNTEKGRRTSSRPFYRFIWYTNGVINKQIQIGHEIPEGFYPGVTKHLSEEFKKLHSEICIKWHESQGHNMKGLGKWQQHNSKSQEK